MNSALLNSFGLDSDLILSAAVVNGFGADFAFEEAVPAGKTPVFLNSSSSRLYRSLSLAANSSNG